MRAAAAACAAQDPFHALRDGTDSSSTRAELARRAHSTQSQAACHSAEESCRRRSADAGRARTAEPAALELCGVWWSVPELWA
eukprot:3218182-Prymnesium_polylepis.1